MGIYCMCVCVTLGIIAYDDMDILFILQAEVEDTLQRVEANRTVIGTIVANKEGKMRIERTTS